MLASKDPSPSLRPSKSQRLLHWFYSQRAAVPRTRLRRLTLRLFDRIGNLIIRAGDPLLEHTVAGATLLMPFSHRLPMYLQWHPGYSWNLARLARHVHAKYPDMTMIDVGANIGDTIAIVRSEVGCSILCIEGDPRFFPLLEANATQFSDVQVVQAFLGETDQRTRCKTLSEYGTARLSEAVGGESLEIRRLDTLLREHPAFSNSRLVKTDTDGYDAKVLRGAEEHLIGAKPALFFEYDPHFLAEQRDKPLVLLQWLQSLDYDRLIFYDNFGELLLDTQTSNQRQLQEITSYFAAYRGQRYCDVCAFHRTDDDIFEAMIAAELQLSSTAPISR